MIKSLSGIRFYLFLLILATHVKYIIKDSLAGQILFPYINLGGIAVLFFFVLSGFCIALGYGDKFPDLNFNNIKTFLTKRIVKLYPLYIITGLIFLIYNLFHNVKWIFAFVFLYIPMLSPFTTLYNGGGNNAGWFIAAIFFCYLMTPFSINMLRQIKHKDLFYILLSLYLVLSVFSIILMYFKTPQNIYTFLYHFPPYRFLHYLMGILAGLIFKDFLNIKINDVLKNYYTKTFVDICVVSIFILTMFIFKKGFLSANIILTPLYLFIILYLCNTNRSILTDFLSNKVSLFLSGLSFECYLIHFVYTHFLVLFCIDYFNNISYSGILLLYISILIITILSSLLYKKLYDKFLIRYFSK